MGPWPWREVSQGGKESEGGHMRKGLDGKD